MIFTWAKYKGSTYATYEFPAWANAIGWLLTFAVVIAVVATMIYIFVTTPGNFFEVMKWIIRSYELNIDWIDVNCVSRKSKVHLNQPDIGDQCFLNIGAGCHTLMKPILIHIESILTRRTGRCTRQWSTCPTSWWNRIRGE